MSVLPTKAAVTNSLISEGFAVSEEMKAATFYRVAEVLDSYVSCEELTIKDTVPTFHWV